MTDPGITVVGALFESETPKDFGDHNLGNSARPCSSWSRSSTQTVSGGGTSVGSAVSGAGIRSGATFFPAGNRFEGRAEDVVS